MKTQHSHILNQSITINKAANSITAEDGTEYNSKELTLLRNDADWMKRNVHKIKYMFAGEVVE